MSARRNENDPQTESDKRERPRACPPDESARSDREFYGDSGCDDDGEFMEGENLAGAAAEAGYGEQGGYPDEETFATQPGGAENTRSSTGDIDETKRPPNRRPKRRESRG